MYKIQTDDGNYAEEYDTADQAYQALDEYSEALGTLDGVHLYKWSDFDGMFIEL